MKNKLYRLVVPSLIVFLLTLNVVRAQAGDPYNKDYLTNSGDPYTRGKTSQNLQAEGTGASTSSSNTNVLDFEGDVIEGRQKRPDIFLQSAVENLSLGEILYLRKDFNDFHVNDGASHPNYYEPRRR